MITKFFIDKINEINWATIRLASPDEILSWSYGEVLKPDTINYRTLRPEKDGLFCEKIFGPEKDYECYCGKYKGSKYKGLVCDRCKVTITESKERRYRFGHVKLITPVVHIWFYRIIPSVLGILLGLRQKDLEDVINYNAYLITQIHDISILPKLRAFLGYKEKKFDIIDEHIVIKAQKLSDKEESIISEDENLERCRKEFPNAFEVGQGAEAIKSILKSLDPEKLKDTLSERIKKSSSQKQKIYTKKIEIIEKFIESETKPEWMILEVLPVIPPLARPIVTLDNGTIATSDINDLYRRVINRNNRLKKLIELDAPELILRNEKRLLQHAVDALLDNTRCRRPMLTSEGRPLKSFADIIKGKQGRFRENLLGKRVDYSARSVIVTGPTLKLHQCGLPKEIAVVIYEPFILQYLLKEKKMEFIEAITLIRNRDERIYDILEIVSKDKPVLLNRAPTLHRLSIQAFEPVLIDGKAIQIHPLVCPPFNADFDGDQMAVHLPLTYEANIEAKTIVLSSLNIMSPAHGGIVMTAAQDIILGIHYLTLDKFFEPEKPIISFTCYDEIELALAFKKIDIHQTVKFILPENKNIIESENQKPIKPSQRTISTTVGRIIFNHLLPDELPYYNIEIRKKTLNEVVETCYKVCGLDKTVKLLDDIKTLGFKYSTYSGLSYSLSDMVIPKNKSKIIEEAFKKVEYVEENYKKGIITPNERYNQIVDIWMEARDKITQEVVKALQQDTKEGKPYNNPVYLMASSGARGNMDQVRQLAGMRGLMAKPSGQIIETPILSNFREGLSILEYFSSVHGARKGLADTALKTSDAGYLTRKMIDIAQSIYITMYDCGTLQGIVKGVIYKGETVEVPLRKRIYGRVARTTIVDPITDEPIVKENEMITEEIATELEKRGLLKILVRSPLKCEAQHGLCALCYGMDLSTGKLVEEGTAVGIIAAQSIGEPGTQLTMKTFHVGGTAHKVVEETRIIAKSTGFVRFENMKFIKVEDKYLVLNNSAEITIVDAKGRELERYSTPAGANLFVFDGQKVEAGTVLARWEPLYTPILAEEEGIVVYKDLIKDETYRVEYDARAKIERKVIMDYRGKENPQLVIVDREGKKLGVYSLPERAYLEVEDGAEIKKGTLLAKIPREAVSTQDITGGLPRVTELFEARRPKDPAIISELDGIVEIGEKKKGKQVVKVRNPQTGISVEYLIPRGKFIRYYTGDYVRNGDPLTDGNIAPHDLLRKGEDAVQEYLLNEIQKVYRSHGVTIDDKHIEIIISQMTRCVKVVMAGGTDLLIGQIVDKKTFKEKNNLAILEGKEPAIAKPYLMGISRAALLSKSFISAASFQETAKVLAEAAISGKHDLLMGLKENIVLGRRIPCGTGYPAYQKLEPKKIVPIFEEREVTQQKGA
ncbi:MAG: DNA-directed RNA polymerase subunit beta' [Planctomycetota bacterium]